MAEHDTEPPESEGTAGDAAEGAAPKRKRRAVSHNLQTGVMLSRTFSIWLKNIGPFSLLALIISVPSFLWEQFLEGEPDPGLVVVIGGTVLNWIVPMLVSATICFSVFQQLAGRPGDIGKSVQVATSRIGNVLGTSFLAALATGIGYLLLVIPGMIISAMLFVAIPAAVVEQPGVVGALNRSAALTKGNRLTIFAMALLVGVMVMIPAIVLGLLMAGAGIALSVATAILGAVFSSFTAVLQTVVYHDLRASRDGLDVQELADVFA